jgi:hypothetical protein
MLPTEEWASWDDAPETRFSATPGDKPEIGLVCVMVPIQTENRLRFRATLGEELEVEVALF